MGSVWGILLVTALFALLAGGVIAYLGLQRHTKDQWRERVQETSQEVLGRSAEAESALPEPRKATFEEIWNRNSVAGSAYLNVPLVLDEKVEAFVRERRESHLSQAGESPQQQQQLPPSVAPAAPMSADGPVPAISVPQAQVSGSVQDVDEVSSLSYARPAAPAKMPPSFAPKRSHWARITPVEPAPNSREHTDLYFEFSKDDRSIA